MASTPTSCTIGGARPGTMAGPLAPIHSSRCQWLPKRNHASRRSPLSWSCSAARLMYEFVRRWLVRAGNWAAAVMSLIYTAKLIGLDPFAYLRDVLERLPTLRATSITELLPHSW